MCGAGQGDQIEFKILQLNLRVQLNCNSFTVMRPFILLMLLQHFFLSMPEASAKVTSVGYPLEPTCTSTDCVLRLAFDK